MVVLFVVRGNRKQSYIMILIIYRCFNYSFLFLTFIKYNVGMQKYNFKGLRVIVINYINVLKMNEVTWCHGVLRSSSAVILVGEK